MSEEFKRDSAVEVSSDDQGLRGSWYTATVIQSTSPQLLVEYHNLFSDDSGSMKLRELVDPLLVRPVPPVEPTRVFRVMEDVDAFHNDGWWEGVVTRVLHQPPSPTRYSVFFRCSREQIDFFATDLRLHREWVRANQWLPPFHPPSGQKRKNGEEGGKRRKNNSGSKEGEGVGMKTGGSRQENGLVSVAARKKHNKTQLTTNGTFKDPPPRPTTHTGRRASTK